MALFKVHFKWQDKDVELMARQLDMTHPYFVSIKNLVFPDSGSLIINPAQDDVRRKFEGTDHIMLPFQTVSLIEELDEESEKKTHRVRNFSMVEESEPGDTSQEHSSEDESE